MLSDVVGAVRRMDMAVESFMFLVLLACDLWIDGQYFLLLLMCKFDAAWLQEHWGD